MKMNSVTCPRLTKSMSKMECFQALAPHFPLIRMRGKQPIEGNLAELGKKCREFDEIGFNPGDNAGIITGSASGLIVVDVDYKDLFMQAVDDGVLFIPPKTLTILTGSGNFHIYFQYPKNGVCYDRRQFPEKGFEILSEGSVVTAPGSIHPNTGWPYYVATQGPIYPAPDWLLALYPETPTAYYALTRDFYNCFKQL